MGEFPTIDISNIANHKNLRLSPLMTEFEVIPTKRDIVKQIQRTTASHGPDFF